MAPATHNRFALFSDENSKSSPVSSPAVDASHSPFVNQVADDSTPWQEVKKKGAPQEQQRVYQPTTKVLVIKGRSGSSSHRTYSEHDGARNTSGSVIESHDKPYDPHENWCGVCSVKFPSKVALQTHIKQTPDHQNYCNLCKRVFKDRNGLKNHVDNSWDHDIFCNLCLSAFKDEWGLKNHFENNYHVGHEFACLTCLLGFKSRSDMDRHLQTAAKHAWCETCNQRFRNQDERDEHWQKTTKHKHCLQPGCDFDCADQATLTEHLKQDHFQCDGCKRVFQSQTKLNQHCETCSFTISCWHCGELCAGKAQLLVHLQNCFVCEECGYQTQHPRNFEVHMTKHTSTDIQCWGCDKTLKAYSSLIAHLESGKCASLPDPTLLTSCLGKWWYSTLYMDIDLHAQIRTGRADSKELQAWIDGGMLHPFVCRGEGSAAGNVCHQVFTSLSKLVRHCEEDTECVWDVARLNIPGLEKEVVQHCMRRDSGAA